jgi:pimeloyl-ACP methyl ester carboxylesterase
VAASDTEPVAHEAHAAADATQLVHDAAPAVRRHRFVVDVSSVAPHGVHRLAGDLVARAAPRAGGPTAVLVCVPGGGMSRRYFDLRAEGAGDDYSMAAHLARDGVVVVLLDHPGVGESDVPTDAYSLTPAVVADVDASAVAVILGELERGTLIDGVDPIARPVPIGCGHSMGGLLSVWMQARHRPYVGIAALGFAGFGLMGQLTEDEQRYADDPERTAQDIAALVERRFGAARSGGSGSGTTGTSPFLLAVEVPDHAKAAIGASGSALLNLCGLTSMIPGASRPQLEAIDVPVFLGVGELDITGVAHRIPAQFPRSRDVTLFVCPGAGHNHNVAPTRTVLWDRLLVWIHQMAGSVASGA